MEQVTKYLIIITSLMTAKLRFTESKNNAVPNTTRNYYPIPYINICDIIGRSSKIYCYCNNIDPELTTRADCWIFSEIKEDDPIWPNFSSQSGLEYITFNVRSENVLTFIPTKAISSLDKLKQISIQFGTIKRIPPYAFKNLPKLRQIILKSNKINILEKYSFSHMMSLSNLSLDENEITELNTDIFFDLPNLQILDLSFNNISLIHEGCFKHLDNLKELNLDNNYISVITKEMLEGLENLSKLNIRYNKLTMIGNLAFSDSSGLKELLIDNNDIEYVSERAFGGLSQLRKLTLSGNRLSKFYEDVLDEVRNLVILDLRGNLLETISYEAIRTVVENDKSASIAVYLDDNPLNCDCRLSWVYLLRNETKHNALLNALEKISCVMEPHGHDGKDKVYNKNLLPDDSYDYYDTNNNDYNNFIKPTNNEGKKLINIPIDALPCPKEIMKSIEETYGHPVQNEIKVKAFSVAGRISPDLTIIILLGKLLY
ncbi:connectin-like [Galleria mellonella]|uniref:Connectin-like n=1 Tax=Galleria mellonella TaxID=7137 RepID=A0A6J3BZK2_GALME|nr:connectin-like [Galleria mellonella]